MTHSNVTSEPNFHKSSSPVNFMQTVSSECSNKCGTTVSCYCKECNSCYCATCYLSIHSFPAFAHHQKHDFLQINNSVIPEANKCVQHNVDINMICTNCWRPVCYDCFQTSAEHKNHSCVSISEYNKRCISDLFKHNTLLDKQQVINEFKYKLEIEAESIDVVSKYTKINVDKHRATRK